MICLLITSKCLSGPIASVPRLTQDLPELGPSRLDRELQKYIWNGKDHLFLEALWEYMNRYTYLPRVKNRSVLAKTVQSAVSGMLLAHSHAPIAGMNQRISMLV